MSMLFYADAKNNILLHPYVVKMSPELALLDEKETLVVIYAYDYNSIFRQFPEQQRLLKSIWKVYGDNKPELLNKEKHSQRIKSAIEAYKSLQYNRNIELIELYNRKIDEQMDILDNDNSVTGTKNASENIDRFRKLIRGIEAEVLEEKLIDGQLKGKVELSYLERAKQNQKMYRSMIAKKG